MNNCIKNRIINLIKLRFSKFILVGAFNTVMGYFFYSIFYYFTKNITISLTSSYIIGILFNFKTFSKFVFYDSTNRKFFIFLIIYLISLWLNKFSLTFFSEKLNLNTYIVQLFLAPLFGIILYFFNKKYVFNIK